MFDSTDGLPGPVIRKQFGNPTVVSPRYVFGPSAHFCFSESPSRPLMSTATIAPVIASKPVANTMASNSSDSLRGPDARLGDRGNRRLAQVHQPDVRAG